MTKKTTRKPSRKTPSKKKTLPSFTYPYTIPKDPMDDWTAEKQAAYEKGLVHAVLDALISYEKEHKNPRQNSSTFFETTNESTGRDRKDGIVRIVLTEHRGYADISAHAR